MSVAVACNVSDGVVLGVDSALTIGDPANPSKVYEDAEKLFALGDLPIGIATYGMAAVGDRSIGNLIREFELTKSEQISADGVSMAAIVEMLRDFMHAEYMRVMAPALEAETKKPYAEIEDSAKPAFGLVVGGYAKGAYLSEIFNILVPFHATANSARTFGKPGDIGAVRFAVHTPIGRYLNGYDDGLVDALVTEINALRQPNLTDEEVGRLRKAASAFQYQIIFTGMPIQKACEYVRFLVDLVISHYKFARGASIVGGKSRIGVVTYKGGRFKILNEG